jgi:hypothetical protein
MSAALQCTRWRCYPSSACLPLELPRSKWGGLGCNGPMVKSTHGIEPCFGNLYAVCCHTLCELFGSGVAEGTCNNVCAGLLGDRRPILVRVVGFEPTATRFQTEDSVQTELHPQEGRNEVAPPSPQVYHAFWECQYPEWERPASGCLAGRGGRHRRGLPTISILDY